MNACNKLNFDKVLESLEILGTFNGDELVDAINTIKLKVTIP